MLATPECPPAFRIRILATLAASEATPAGLATLGGWRR